MSSKSGILSQMRGVDSTKESSNLSLSAFNKLKISTLKKTADQILTRREKLYQGPFIYDADGDLSKEWFIWYKFLHPTKKTPTGKSFYQRFKIFGGDRIGWLSHCKTLSERRELAHSLKIFVEEFLEAGSNPFNVKKDKSIDNNIVSRIDHYVTVVDNSNLSDNTKRKYRLDLKVFKEWIVSAGLDGLEISEIKKDHIRDFMDYLPKSKRKDTKEGKSKPVISSGKTLKNYLGNLRTFFNYYIDNYEGVIEKNNAKSIKADKVVIKGNASYNEREFKAIKEAANETDPYIWFICQVIYYAAFRTDAEALSAKVGWFNFRNNNIVVPGDKAKGRENQVIPMYPELKKLLLSKGIDQEPHDHCLFAVGDKPGVKKFNKDTIYRRFAKIKQVVGIEHNRGLYTFKHTRACHLYDDGADLRDIQRLFRHKDLYVTMNYLRTLNRIERDREYNKGREI